jgi:DNA-binding NarL/FixJ family response regulator
MRLAVFSPRENRTPVTHFRIMLVDDSRSFLDSASALLEAVPGFEVVARLRSAEDALAELRFARPDVVIVDVHMPGMSGLEAARRIKTRPNPPRVLLTTIHDGPEYQRAATAVGADGFVPKSEFGARILAAIVGED